MGHVAVAAVRVRVVRVVRNVPLIHVVIVVEGICGDVREEASSAAVPATEPVVTEAPPNEAAAPELSASRNARAEAATAAESTHVAPRMTPRHGRPRRDSQREHEETSEHEDRQATIAMPCGRHEHSIGNCRAIAMAAGPPRDSCLGALTTPNDVADASAACRHVDRRADARALRKSA